MTKYRVAGSTAVKGHAPGTVFEAELDERQEARLLRSGALEKTRAHVTTEGDDAPDDDDDEGSAD